MKPQPLFQSFVRSHSRLDPVPPSPMCIFKSKPSPPVVIEPTKEETAAKVKREEEADARDVELAASRKRLEASNAATKLANEKRAAELDAQTELQRIREQALIKAAKKKRLETKVADTRSRRGRRSLITGGAGGQGFLTNTAGGNYLST